MERFCNYLAEKGVFYKQGTAEDTEIITTVGQGQVFYLTGRMEDMEIKTV
jgi:hypothetical protein